jgi:hypothetical protein
MGQQSRSWYRTATRVSEGHGKTNGQGGTRNTEMRWKQVSARPEAIVNIKKVLDSHAILPLSFVRSNRAKEK